MDGIFIVIDPVHGITMTKSKDNVEQVKKSNNCSFQEIKQLFTDFSNEEEEAQQTQSQRGKP